MDLGEDMMSTEKKHKTITVEQLEKDMKRMAVQKAKIEKIIGKSVK